MLCSVKPGALQTFAASGWKRRHMTKENGSQRRSKRKSLLVWWGSTVFFFSFFKKFNSFQGLGIRTWWLMWLHESWSSMPCQKQRHAVPSMSNLLPFGYPQGVEPVEQFQAVQCTQFQTFFIAMSLIKGYFWRDSCQPSLAWLKLSLEIYVKGVMAPVTSTIPDAFG